MIEVKGITKQYGKHKAVDDISFSVPKGEILGFLGPNGAGKSTTMKILSGVLSATEGEAFINGHNVAKEPLQAKACIGYLPETPPVYLNMDVESYLVFAARLHGVPGKEVRAAIEDAMEKCGLVDVRQRLIGNLSKGYRQRVGLAQAIAHKPEVLILDEPTVGLDPRQIIDVRNLIRSLGEDRTVILSTHILPEVQATCQRVIVIDQGKIIATDSLDGIAARMQSSTHVHVGLVTDPEAKLDRFRDIDGVQAVFNDRQGDGFSLRIECSKGIDVRAKIAEICVQEKLGLLHLSRESISLEDAFVKLISKDITEKETLTMECNDA